MFTVFTSWPHLTALHQLQSLWFFYFYEIPLVIKSTYGSNFVSDLRFSAGGSRSCFCGIHLGRNFMVRKLHQLRTTALDH